jgi:hypothetical protein
MTRLLPSLRGNNSLLCPQFAVGCQRKWLTITKLLSAVVEEVFE